MHAQSDELEAARSALAQRTPDRDALHARLDAQRAAHEKMRTDLEARAHTREQHWAVEVDRAREALKTAHRQTATLEKDSAARIEQLTRELAHTLEAQRRAADAAFKRDAAQASQMERLQAQLSAALAQLAQKDAEHAVVLRSLGALTTRARAGMEKAAKPALKRAKIAP
jgi:hypothetical protein